jgi:hypothetical protein
MNKPTDGMVHRVRTACWKECLRKGMFRAAHPFNVVAVVGNVTYTFIVYPNRFTGMHDRTAGLHITDELNPRWDTQRIVVNA